MSLHWTDWQVPDHRIAEHRWAFRDGDVAASALAEDVFIYSWAQNGFA